MTATEIALRGNDRRAYRLRPPSPQRSGLWWLRAEAARVRLSDLAASAGARLRRPAPSRICPAGQDPRRRHALTPADQLSAHDLGHDSADRQSAGHPPVAVARHLDSTHRSFLLLARSRLGLAERVGWVELLRNPSWAY